VSEQRPIEWLDIVDEVNRVIGRAPRDEVHRRGLRHRSVHLLLLDGGGRVFVQRRSPLESHRSGLVSLSAAGHVDSGERCPTAAVRELHEELGVRVDEDALERTGGLSPQPITGNEFVEIYRVISDAPLTLQAEEIADGRWSTPEELETWMRRSPEAFTEIFHAVWASARPPRGD